MKLRKICTVSILVFACLAGTVFAGGQQDSAPAGETSTGVVAEDVGGTSRDWLVEDTDDHITVIDSYGNKVTIDKPVESIVATGMGEAFAAFKAMKAEGMVSAISDYVTRNTTFFPVLSQLPSVTVGEQSVDNEMLIQLNPGFILGSPFYMPMFNSAVLEEIPVVQLTFNSTDAYRIFGALIDKEDEANEFIQWINGYTDIIDERIGSLSKEDYQDVFLYYGGEYGMSAPPPYGTFGKDNQLRNELIERAGGRSLSRDIPGDWITVDAEWVIENNPEMIIRLCYIINDSPELGYSVVDDSSAEVLMHNIMTDQPAFEGCDAVRNKEVHMLYGDIVQDSWFLGLVYMAKWMHPELFEDLDPVEMHQEYITRFQRLDYDVKTQGLFTYSAEQAE